MTEWQTAVTFIAYCVLMLGIGVYFYFKSSNIEDYLLGGRGMVTGTVVLVLWKQTGLGENMYEIAPGFAANCFVIFLVNAFVGQAVALGILRDNVSKPGVRTKGSRCYDASGAGIFASNTSTKV